jgi:uncharacterized protein YjiK
MIIRIIQIVIVGIFLSSMSFAGQNEIKISELIVQSEAKFNKLLEGQSEKDKHEASGVLFLNNEIFVVFDNYSMIAKINIEFDKAKLFGENKKGIGYEGITYDNVNDRFYLIEESLDNKGALNARLRSASKDFTIEFKKWLKYNFQSDNKGFEGLTIVTKNDETYVLALCEGNDCDSGKISKIHGAGRIKVFETKGKKWKYIASIRLPPSLQFMDYSGIDVNNKNILAITSQGSSAVWTGELDVKNWKIVDLGHVYNFPKDKNGNKIYCNIEGVSWIANDRLVAVSDAKKKEQPEECHEKDQSIHIISIKTPNKAGSRNN